MDEALAAICWHLDVALDSLRAGGRDCVIVLEAAAFLAQTAVADEEPEDAQTLPYIAGTRRGAEASPARVAPLRLVKRVRNLPDVSCEGPRSSLPRLNVAERK